MTPNTAAQAVETTLGTTGHDEDLNITKQIKKIDCKIIFWTEIEIYILIFFTKTGNISLHLQIQIKCNMQNKT